jgi:hypothetical protein
VEGSFIDMEVTNKGRRGMLIFTVSVGVIVISVFGAYLWHMHNKSEELGLSKNSLALADTLIELRVGKDKISSFKTASTKFVEERVFTDLQKYKVALESLDNASFNVTEYYKTKGFSKVEDPIKDAMDEAGVTELHLVADDTEDVPDIKPDEFKLEDDKRLFTKNGDKYIKVVDMVFNASNIDIIAFNGINMQIEKSQVPQTYKMMISNPNNIYKYSTHKSVKEKSTQYIDVAYKEVYNGSKSILIRVFNNGSRITSFEVRE